LTLSANCTATGTGITISAASWAAIELLSAGGVGWFNQAGGRGQLYLRNSSGLIRALAGGNWAGGANSGSRAEDWNDAPWVSSFTFGGRGRSDHLSLV
jgi:hypothetical protein